MRERMYLRYDAAQVQIRMLDKREAKAPASRAHIKLVGDYAVGMQRHRNESTGGAQVAFDSNARRKLPRQSVRVSGSRQTSESSQPADLRVDVYRGPAPADSTSTDRSAAHYIYERHVVQSQNDRSQHAPRRAMAMLTSKLMNRS